MPGRPGRHGRPCRTGPPRPPCQPAIDAGSDKVEAISTGPTSHRGTFGKAAAEWKTWFDTLR